MEDKLSGYTLIHSLDDVFKVLLDTKQGHKLIMGEDAVNEYFTPESYLSFIKNAKRINPIITITSSSNIKSTEDFILSKIAMASKPQDVFDIIGGHPREAYIVLKGLAEKVQKAVNDSLIISNRISEMQHKIVGLEEEKEYMNNQLSDALQAKNYFQRMFEMLRNRMQHKFLKPIHEDSLNFCISNSYDRVIYIKEISHLSRTYSLIEALQQIILMLYQTPCRICVIEPYGASLRNYQYPKLKPDTELTTKDIMSADILMVGYHPRIMEGIMHNTVGSSFCIVYDRDGSNIEHIQGSNVTTYYTTSNPEEVEMFGLPKRRTITVPTQGCLSIDDIPNYMSKTSSEKLTAYSGMKIVQEILKV